MWFSSFLSRGISPPPLLAFPLGADSPCQGEMSRSDRGDRERCPRRGRMRGQILDWVRCTQGIISPPAGGEFLCPWRQRNQSAPGDGSGWALRAHIRLTPDPITGDALLLDVAGFPARKKGVASAIPSGPLGPGFAKIAAGAVPHLRLGFPNQRSWSGFRCRGDPCGGP